jgi:Holliday junction resolvase RusA-like endonuclease
MIQFFVSGVPIPKQSFRYDGNGRGHTDPRVKVWQSMVGYEAGMAMIKTPILIGAVAVVLDFNLPDKHRKDIDNLAKCVLDSLNGICWKDDSQVIDLHITKTFIKDNSGVDVRIFLRGEKHDNRLHYTCNVPQFDV